MEARAGETSGLSNFYTFAVWMLGDRAAALLKAVEIVKAGPTEGFAGWAKRLSAQVGEPRGVAANRRVALAALDELLRVDVAVTVAEHPRIQRGPRRLRVLQWELKRACLLL